MEEYTQITLDEWTQWREDIRQKLAETAGNFVYIGYRLKQIRDSGMYDGAENIFEFAQKEYGLGKSTVSRFIAINEKYSEGGNSLELKEEFRNYSSSKLAEMLTLPDSELELITERTTIKEIRELKEFNKQEIPEDDMIPGQCEIGEYIPVPGEKLQAVTPLDKCLADFFCERKEVLRGMMKCLELDPPDYRTAMDLMNPSGQASHRKGIVFLVLFDWNTGVKYKIMTQPDPVIMTWQELLDDIFQLYGARSVPDAWEAFYGENDTTNDNAVATSQQQEPEPKKEEETEERNDDREAEPDGTAGEEDEPETEDRTDDAQPEREDAGDQQGSDGGASETETAGGVEETAETETDSVMMPKNEPDQIVKKPDQIAEKPDQITDDDAVATSQQESGGRSISGTLFCTIQFKDLYVGAGQRITEVLFPGGYKGRIVEADWGIPSENDLTGILF